MKNVLKIIKDDFKCLSSNVISILVVIGLVAVPSLYGWFNIAGYWDPYNTTQDLEIAVVNEDEGYNSEIWPIDIKFGMNVVDTLNNNDKFKWSFTNNEEAMKRLNDGNCFAVLIIPKDFSDQMVHILTGRSSNANLYYYCNQKEGPVITKITDVGLDDISQQVNSEISSVIYDSFLKVVFNLTSDENISSLSNLKGTIASSLDDSINSMNSLKPLMLSLTNTVNSLDKILDTVSDGLPQKDSALFAQIQQKYMSVMQDVEKSKQQAEQFAQILVLYPTLAPVLAPLVSSIQNIFTDIDALSLNVSQLMNNTMQLPDSVNDDIASLHNINKTLTESLNYVTSSFDSLIDSLKFSRDRINALSSADTIDQLKEICGSDSDSFVNLITHPVSIEREAIYPVENYGMAMTGFFASMSIWAGCLILVAIMLVDLEKKREVQLKNFKKWQLYIGRFAIFAYLAIAQAILLTLGCVFFLQVKMANPLLFVLTGCIVALLFEFFIYTLVVVFASTGKVLALILLVLQVAASGGTYPISMVAEGFRAINPFLPVNYSVFAFKLCIGGCSSINQWLYYIGILTVMLVGASLILGVVLRGPFGRLCRWFEEQLRKTKLIGI